MTLFKPNVEKMEKHRNVVGLIKALKHKDRDIRLGAAKALDRIGWHPGEDPEKEQYSLFQRAS